jgi:hypothetical protein
MVKAPTTQGSFSELLTAPTARAEAFVNVFGQHLFSSRNQALALIRERVESDAERTKLGRLRRAVYDAVAALPPEGQQAALRLAEWSADTVLQLLLALFGAGPACQDLVFGSGHALAYRVVLEVRDAESGEVVETADVNRAGQRFLGDYFGRWLNQFADHL